MGERLAGVLGGKINRTSSWRGPGDLEVLCVETCPPWMFGAQKDINGHSTFWIVDTRNHI